jgi:hypothetical protein
MINALHIFSASYFSGSAKITEVPEEGEAGAAQGGTDLVTPKRPECPPEQKQKVVNAINAYVQSAQARAQKASPPAQ